MQWDHYRDFIVLCRLRPILFVGGIHGVKVKVCLTYSSSNALPLLSVLLWVVYLLFSINTAAANSFGCNTKQFPFHNNYNHIKIGVFRLVSTRHKTAWF